jgi:hypothetical protein
MAAFPDTVIAEARRGLQVLSARTSKGRQLKELIAELKALKRDDPDVRR